MTPPALGRKGKNVHRAREVDYLIYLIYTVLAGVAAVHACNLTQFTPLTRPASLCVGSNNVKPRY